MQQKPFDYMPLKAGLKYITRVELETFGYTYCKNCNHSIIKSGLKGELNLNKYYHSDGDVLSYPSCLKTKCKCKKPEPIELCPKIYTTRKSPLKGEYYVVEGSRFKAKPVEPRIEFKVDWSFELNLSLEAIKISGTWVHHELFQKETTDQLIQRIKNIFNMPVGHSFPEFDLGYVGATFEDLKNVLLDCNKGATVDTPFYVNKSEQINPDRRLDGPLQEGERVSSRPPVTSSEVVA